MAEPEPLFVPYRAIGVVTGGVPPAVQRLGAETFCVASVGRGWHVLDCATLATRAVGPLVGDGECIVFSGVLEGGRRWQRPSGARPRRMRPPTAS